MVLYEVDNTHRQIYIDGRTLPVNPQPTWGGYSVGRWEADTLVVDAAGFNDQGWLHSMDILAAKRCESRSASTDVISDTWT